jgi:hypothetical protein
MTKAAQSTPKTSKSLWKLGGSTPSQLIRNVFGEIKSNNILGRASELAFDFLFSLFPLILFMVTLFGLFASHSVELQNDLLSYFGDFLPPDAFHLLRTTAIELAANASDGMLTFGIDRGAARTSRMSKIPLRSDWWAPSGATPRQSRQQWQAIAG